MKQLLGLQHTETMKQSNVSPNRRVANSASGSVHCCIYSIGQHTMLHLQHPNHRASMLQVQHGAGPFTASTALAGVCWPCNMDMLHLQHLATESLILHLQHYRWAGLAWVIGALSQKNKTIPIGIPLSLSLWYRRYGLDGLEYGYTRTLSCYSM